MLDLLTQCIDKKREHSLFLDIEKQVNDFVNVSKQEDILLTSENEGIALTFNQYDVLVKIEMLKSGKCYESFLLEFCDNTVSPNKIVIREKIGEPTANMKYPPSMGAKEQFIYNKGQYWIVILFKNENLESISFVSSSLIADNIKNKFVPIRLCKSKD